MKDLIPPVPVDEEAGDREASYGIELTDWAEWLGMEIEPETLSRYAEADIIVHCVWEMTFFGYSQADIEKTVEELERARESQEGNPSTSSGRRKGKREQGKKGKSGEGGGGAVRCACRL